MKRHKERQIDYKQIFIIIKYHSLSRKLNIKHLLRILKYNFWQDVNFLNISYSIFTNYFFVFAFGQRKVKDPMLKIIASRNKNLITRMNRARKEDKKRTITFKGIMVNGASVPQL